MRLTSTDGSEVRIRMDGYQFPAMTTPGDWDANWLIVEGAVRLATGESWSFRDPCLTTWEVSSLVDWLRQVADGSVQPSAFPSDDDEERLQVFTEPNLAFSLAARSQARVTLRVHFSLESLPPRLREDRDLDLFDFFVPLNVREAEAQSAADALAADLAAFPAR
ncbi:WapI family immunity protein [Phycicoccus duodecadis]|uniref:WapI family immunity protein n=1 Tax=Phycicoccus duodecadis TaxID=173053 RepID=UPI000C702D01